MLLLAYLRLSCSCGPKGPAHSPVVHIPMNKIHFRFMSPLFLLATKLSGDVRVDVTGVPDQLSVEGADSAYAVAALLRLSEANAGTPFLPYYGNALTMPV
jgi:hypothetical protein